MKAIAVFAAVLAVSSASPQILFNGLGAYHGLGYGLGYNGLTYAAAPGFVAPHVVPQVVAPVATKTQYHAQDELGQASFGHAEPGQAHAAVRDAAGGVRGTFSHISPEGQTFTTHYIADHNGYRVASNALPVAPSVAIQGPVDTPEVMAAKAQHFAAVAEAKSRQKRQILYSGIPAGHSAVYGTPAVYSNVVAAPAVSYSNVVASPAVTYSNVVASHPVVAATHPVTYAAAHPLTYSAAHTVVAAPAVREATLTKVVNTPGHAVSYRVD